MQKAVLTFIIALLSLTFACSEATESSRSCTSASGTTAIQLRPEGSWSEPQSWKGTTAIAGVTALTGNASSEGDCFDRPELADPYVTLLPDGVFVSGTAQYALKFRSLTELEHGGPYEVVWNDFFYSDGTPMEGDRLYAHSWDMKPVPWIFPKANSQDRARLWDPERDTEKPTVVWYGGHMRPEPDESVAHWPRDNFSRDVFAFVESLTGLWLSQADSIFSWRKQWPRNFGDFTGHRYGHQIIMIPKMINSTPSFIPAVFYEEVTKVRSDGRPAETRIFMDEMLTPFEARGEPIELISPLNPLTGLPFPSTIREGGDVLVEGPLYFRFDFDGDEWEAIGFSAGSYYGRYPAVFASRKVKDGYLNKAFEIDLNDDGTDFNDAGRDLGAQLDVFGGPGRPAVIVSPQGRGIMSSEGTLQLLMHAYRNADTLGRGLTAGLAKTRTTFYASLHVDRRPNGRLRFQIVPVPPRQLSNGLPSISSH